MLKIESLPVVGITRSNSMILERRGQWRVSMDHIFAEMQLILRVMEIPF